MAQLSDDCFAFGGALMPVDEAVGLIAARVTPVDGVERVALHEADNRVLAQALHTPLPLPLFANSAVDGYALRSADLPHDAPRAYTVAGRVQAGSPADPIAANTVVRIFTGAPMPQGADTVFMQEDVELGADGRVILPAGLRAGANMRPAGEDIAQGALAISAGLR
ncbi:MAG: molybdopterin biosynthesis protein, partial [Hyphomicrobiales bacterium]|nr:molybdopterin biosynthesis protein [Hyphomicrobiales bacterium]